MALGKLLQQLWDVFRDPRAALGMWITAVVIGLTEAIVLWFGEARHVQMYGIQLLLVPVAIALTALGFYVRQSEPPAKLFNDPNVHAAPFMVAQTIELYQKIRSGKFNDGGSRRDLIRRADTAVDLFLSEVRPLKTVGKLTRPVADSIYPPRAAKPTRATKPARAVWAVCGRKQRSNADELYKACQRAHAESSHIERVFFPPDSPEDGRDICAGIELHLLSGMTVRVFESRDKALQTLYEFHLPRGFGMTWIGTGVRLARDQHGNWVPKCSADSSAKVFVHWGGFSGLEHHGVILTGNADWARHLWELCNAIQTNAKIANANEAGQIVPMTLEAFLAKYPHYGE